ncbi:MAG TPA: tetratricopeptide repeat protein [Planctomycetota bacterium]|nr:tetratricopeptide repeat protein [Planctomycetota bacterium]
MKSSRSIPCIVLGLLIPIAAACAAGTRDDRAAGPFPPAAVSPPEAGSPAPLATSTSPSGDPELALWNDPAFRRRFAESYAAETEIEPRITDAEREPMQEVLDLLASNRLDQAAGLLAKQRTESASAVFDFTLANIRFQQEDFPRAAAAYRAAVDKHPKFRRAWRNLGLIHVRRGEFTEAVPALTRVIELGGGDATTYGLLGFAYSKLGNDLSAESAYRMAVLLDPATMDWKMGLARSFFEQERFADAISLCENLIAGEPDSADLWLLQANAYVGLGKPIKAAENYELVDRLGGSTADSLEMLGDIYVNEDLYDLAVDTYVRAMQKRPEGGADRAIRAAKALTARGALQETGRLAEAIERIQGDRLGAGERKDLLKLRARVAVAEGAGEEEARVLEEIVALDPLDGEALILLGQHHGRAGDVEQAIFYYERAASLEAFEADAKVRHAQLLVGQARYAEALPLLRRAQTLKPRDNIQDYLEQVERVAQAR